MGMHVIISGGSKGIGKELAIKYAAQGAHVTIIARKENDLQKAKSEIGTYRKNHIQQVRTVSLDLTKLSFPTPSSNENMTHEHRGILESILGEHRKCDILINCCGSSIPARFEDITQQQFHYMMDVNYFSAVNLTRLLLPVMKARSLANHGKPRGTNSNGHIVFVSSMCGIMSFFGYSAYSASKFALVGLAEALQMELQPFEINVTVSFPPDTLTPGFEEENKLKPALTAEISKSGSIYSPDDVAQSIVRDVKAKRFYSTVGLENWLALMVSNSFMPSTFGRVLFECLIAGPLKLVAFVLVKSWYSMVKAAAPNEVIRSKVELKCSKEVKHRPYESLSSSREAELQNSDDKSSIRERKSPSDNKTDGQN